MAERKVFHDSVVPIPVESGPAPNGLVVNTADASHRAETMTVHFSLALPADTEADLEAKVARGETVPVDTLSGYGAKKADADSLTGWLAKNGFQVDSVSADNTSIYATAPVADIEKNLQVQMVRVNHEGLTYTAARNAPSLPVSVGAAVQAIGGLQPFRQAHKNNTRRPVPRTDRTAGGPAAAGPQPNPRCNSHGVDRISRFPS
ncbi:MAG: protease pro-enzyme activation domain-containing protein, partial [Nakamurella sp.]